jgi:type I restriction enzyme, S subunit
MSKATAALDSNTVLNAIRERIAQDVRKGWTLTTLGDCFKWSSGGTPRRTEPAYFGGEIPWAVIGDLNDSVLTETENAITEVGLENSSAKWVEPGSVLIAMYGSIGKLGIAGRRITTNQAIAFTNPDPVDSKYLYYYLLWQRSSLARLGKGATQLNISQTILKEFPFVLAPPRAQRHIVAEIEKQFSRLDEAVANLKRVKANLKRYKAAVLQSAVEGRLVPTEAELARVARRSYESGTELLTRVSLPTRAGSALKPSDLPDQPEGWAWARLDAIGAIKGGITVDRKRNDPTARSVSYLRVANVQRGYLDLSEIKQIDATEADIEQLRLQPGDILFNEGGDRDKLGRGWIWEGQLAECIHQNHVFRTRLFSDDLCGKLVSWWGNTFGRDYFLREGKQTTNLASINMSKLSAFPVPIPPCAEQRRIVEEVERRLSLIHENAAEVESNLQRAEMLRQSILKKAFQA